MQVKHQFNVEVPDDPAAAAAGQVLPSHWNQDHTFLVEPVSLVGNDGGVTAPARAIPVGSGLRFSAGALALVGVPAFFQANEPQFDGQYIWFSPVGSAGATVVLKDELGEFRKLNDFQGWAQYLDTQYTALSPFEILNGVTTTLPNNAANNITQYLPDDVTLYDPLTQKLTPAAVGDYNAITIRFTAEASATSTYLEFGIDTGNPTGPIFRDIKVFPKGAGVEHPFTFTCLGFSLNNFTGNGGIVKLKAVGGDVEVYDINYHFARLIPS